MLVGQSKPIFGIFPLSTPPCATTFIDTSFLFPVDGYQS